MKFDNIFCFLKLVTFLLGGKTIILSWYYSNINNNPGPLYIAEAIIVAGPLESFLKSLAEKELSDPRDMVTLIDYITSFGFIYLLYKAVKNYI